MKKILIALFVLSGGIGTVAYGLPTTSELTSQAAEKYEKIGKVRVYAYSSNLHWFYDSRPLYRGVNTCDAYYFYDTIDGYYYPVRKNSHTEYLNKDVSGYKWMCTIGDTIYFFNY